MTDLHRLPADREDKFWNGQRSLNHAPLFSQEGVEIVDEVRPSRIGWLIWPALFLGFAVVIGIAQI